jgi:hypothetical protein
LEPAFDGAHIWVTQYEQKLQRRENQLMNKDGKQFVRNGKPLFRALAGVLTLACVATAADAPKLSFKFTTINIKGSKETDTYAINNDGVIVGTYVDSSGILHGLKLVGGKAINIDDPKATGGTYCYGVNSSGVIVGAYGTSSGGSQGFLYQGGKFHRHRACRDHLF